jgi:hypothetical protein
VKQNRFSARQISRGGPVKHVNRAPVLWCSTSSARGAAARSSRPSADVVRVTSPGACHHPTVRGETVNTLSFSLLAREPDFVAGWPMNAANGLQPDVVVVTLPCKSTTLSVHDLLIDDRMLDERESITRG